MKKIFILLIGIACFTTAYSQKKDITLEEIWKENQFYPKSVRGFNSMNDGEHYSTMERVEDGQEIIKYRSPFTYIDGIILGITNKIGRVKVVHDQRSHGRSGYTLSLTNTTDPRKTMYFPKFNWPRISNPYIKFPMSKQELSMLKKKEKESIVEINDAIKNNPHDIAAIIIEPIQGEGGDNFFRDEYFVNLREICNKNDMLLIFDEVQTGFGK